MRVSPFAPIFFIPTAPAENAEFAPAPRAPAALPEPLAASPAPSSATLPAPSDAFSAPSAITLPEPPTELAAAAAAPAVGAAGASTPLLGLLPPLDLSQADAADLLATASEPLATEVELPAAAPASPTAVPEPSVALPSPGPDVQALQLHLRTHLADLAGILTRALTPEELKMAQVRPYGSPKGSQDVFMLGAGHRLRRAGQAHIGGRSAAEVCNAFGAGVCMLASGVGIVVTGPLAVGHRAARALRKTDYFSPRSETGAREDLIARRLYELRLTLRSIYAALPAVLDASATDPDPAALQAELQAAYRDAAIALFELASGMQGLADRRLQESFLIDTGLTDTQQLLATLQAQAARLTLPGGLLRQRALPPMASRGRHMR